MTTYSWEKKESAGSWVPFEGTPNAQNPTEDFTEGTWDIRVTVSDNGQTAQETKTAYVEVTGGSAYTGPLDLVPGATLFLSHRAPSDGATGDAIIVRRSSDDATQTFGLSNNEVDSAAILSFIGAGNGFVHTWIDLMGSGVSFSRTGGASPSQVGWSMQSGNPIVGPRAGAAGVNFSPYGTEEGVQGTPNGFTCFFVCYLSSNSGTHLHLISDDSDSDTEWDFGFRHNDMSLQIVNDPDSTQYDAVDMSSAGLHILEMVFDSSGNPSFYIDGVSQTLDGGPAVPIGVTGDSGTLSFQSINGMENQPYENGFYEIAAWNSELSAGNRLAIRQNMAAYYGITLP